MRVIAGKLGGRLIISPKKARTHPMSDKIRNSLFNTLGDISGLSVLDVFSGSGALAIEAISRGAKSAITIDSDKTANDTIKKNIETLRIDSQVESTKAYFSSWSNNNRDKTFDLILADPPYNDPQFKHLDKIGRHLKNNGTLAISLPTKLDDLRFVDVELIQVKKYGNAQLAFYRKVS